MLICLGLLAPLDDPGISRLGPDASVPAWAAVGHGHLMEAGVVDKLPPPPGRQPRRRPCPEYAGG